MNMENIIVAVDFSKVSVNDARYAAEMANFYKARLWVYHCYQLPITYLEVGYPFVSAAELQNVAEFEMQELIKELSGIPGQNVAIEGKVELTGLVDGLTAFCIEIKADMLVMG